MKFITRPLTAAVSAATLLCIGLATIGVHAQINPRSNGYAAAPDSWLLEKQGQPWWYKTKPSPNPVTLNRRDPTPAEKAVTDRARALMSSRPAKAFALMDGDTIIHEQYNAPADAESVLFGLSMGKTVVSMGVGQAICAGKLRLDTKASEVVPELSGKALGAATVRDLLRMASGTTAASDDAGGIWTPQEAAAWGQGNLNLFDLITQDRNTRAARGAFSDYKPGEVFSYKTTDPTLLAIMVSRATGMPWNQWLQSNVLDPMGAAHPGLYVQDRAQNAQAEAGLRIRLDDWMRFALWVKRSSKETGCFGDYVRAAMSKQISTGSSPADRKFGKQFGGYGYFIWTDNETAPNTSWAWGYGGQKIGWYRDSDRMLVVFSNVANWMDDVYQVARDWDKIPSAGAARVSQATNVTPSPSASPPSVQPPPAPTTVAVASAPAAPTSTSSSWQSNLSGRINFRSITPPNRWEYIHSKYADTVRNTTVFGDLVMPTNIKPGEKVPAVIISHGSSGVSNDDYEVWGRALNSAGYAVFIIDSFKPRGVEDTTVNQELVNYSASLADALYGLRLLASHPQIDARHIFSIGFSRGGTTAFESAWPTWRAPVNTEGAAFAGHVAMYPGMCNVRYRTDHLDKASAPILMLLADRDNEDFQDVGGCVKYAQDLAAKGNAIVFKEYKGSYHGFDRQSLYHTFRNAMTGKGCDMDVYMTTQPGSGLGDAFDVRTQRKITQFADFNKAALDGCGPHVTVRVSGDSKFREQAVKDVLDFLAAQRKS